MNAKQQAAIDALARGEKVVGYHEGGHSMVPLLRSHQKVTIEPVLLADLAKGDIVLAKVHGRVVLHKVTATKGHYVQIGNNHGRINGWTRTVYGIVTEKE